MDVHSIVVVSLHSPKEKVWGELMAISVAGVTLRGIDVNSFDDFVHETQDPATEPFGFPTLFFPMNRIERIALDERRGAIPSLAEVFQQKSGKSLADYLARFA